MAGVYSHLAAVRSIYGKPSKLHSAVSFQLLRYVIGMQCQYVDLGSISPDSPYLYWLNTSANAKGWGDLMHYCLPGDFIRDGIDFLCNHDFNNSDVQKAIAWLFGYTSHVVMDLTVHPVVERKVGPYEGNEREHKRCEAQQDAFIFYQTTKIDIVEADYLKLAGLQSCVDDNTKRLHDFTSETWIHCLKRIRKRVDNSEYLKQPPTCEPNPSEWFSWFCFLLDHCAEEGNRIPIISRIGRQRGIVFPKKDKIDMTYVDGLKFPNGSIGHFPEAFHRGQANLIRYWRELSDALINKSPDRFTLPNGNLDTGKELGSNKLIFW